MIIFARSILEKRWVLLFLVVLLASILRLYQLGTTPRGLEWDEVALGYDAYSILHTGRDQFGHILPLTFRSLDDYKPPLYVYAAVPGVALFDLNEFSTRLPGAIFGIIAVLATYWLAKIIFSHIPSLQKYSSQLALLSSLFLAISPWHLQFSRAAFEVNLAVTITILAVATFLKGMERPRYLLASALLFGVDLFSYHSIRVVSPLLIISLFLLFNRHLPMKKYIAGFFLIWGFFVLLFIPILISKEAQIRFTATNIFNPGARSLGDRDLPAIFYNQRSLDKTAGYEIAGKIFHNQRFIYTDYESLKQALVNYISNFNFEFLFVKADAPLHHAPGFGLLYIAELPFILVGFLYILKNGFNRYSLILLIWMLLSPIPTAITKEAPHAVRSEIILPTFQIFTALGIVLTIILLKQQSKIILAEGMTIVALLFTINMSYYLHQYYVHTNFELSGTWMNSRKEAVKLTEELKDQYDEVIVSLRIEDPLDFWLFYTKYSPSKYLKEGGTISGGFADVRNHFDKYKFKYFDYERLPRNKRILLVGTPYSLPPDFPGEVNIVKTIYNLDGSISLIIAENKR